MKIGHPVLLICFSFVCTALHGEGAETGSTVLARGLFSYQAPPGWTVPSGDLPENVASISRGPRRNGFAPDILVFIQGSSKFLSDYVAAYLKSLKEKPAIHLSVLEQKVFSTSAGLDGIRVVIANAGKKRDLLQVLYFFDGGSNKVIVVIANSLAYDGKREIPLFDASLKTFSLE
jgi:hypothetical protein